MFETRWLNEGLSWSARKRMDIVRRKTCPDRSCPFLKRGLTLSVSLTSGELNMDASKIVGCVSGVKVDFEKQNWRGTVRGSPDGRYAMHSPPE